jgi:hypothetical protein
MRRTYRKVTHVALIALALLAAVATAAVATSTKPRHKHAIKQTIKVNLISATGDPTKPPNMGDQFVEAGVATQRPGGQGAEVDHITITGFSPSGAETYTGKFTVFLYGGTESGTITGAAVHHADNSLTFSGTGTYDRGTGTYKGITGRFTFTGTAPGTPGSVTTLHTTGTATY